MKVFKFFTVTFLLVITIVVFNNCNRNDDCDPSLYCDTLPYDSGYVKIRSSFNGNGIPIVVYDGFADDNVVLFYDTMYATEYSYYLPLGKRYAVEAYYYELNKTIIALDGDKLKESTFWNCDEECHELAEITLDVKKL